MEMQAQSPEHLKLQVASQTCMPQQSGAFYRQQQISSSSGIWKKTWQTDSDVSIRRSILDRITQILRHRQTQSSVEYQQKLPDFVRRLEENLYRDAASKEEYLDLHTLEQRLQCAAKRVPAKSFQSPQQHGIGSVGCMIPTPGSTADVIPMTGYRGSVMPTPGVDTMIPTPGICGSTSYVPRSMGIAVPSGTMIPTPGHAVPQIQNSCQGTAHSINLSNVLSSRGASNMPNLQNGIGPFSTAEGGVVHGSAAPQGTSGMRLINNNHMTSCIGVGSQMIPTPGLDMSHSITVGHPSVPLGMNTPRLQQQQYLAGNHVYHGINGTALGKDQRRTSPLLHTNGGMRNSAHFMANSQHLIPNVQPSPGGNSVVSTASHPNPNYGKLQNYHRTNHQRQSVAQNPLPAPISRPLGQPNSINTVNTLESGGTNSKTCSSAMTMSLAATASTMIPVPGMTARQLPRAQSPQQAKTFNQQSPLQQPQNEVIEGSALVEVQQTPLSQGNDRHLEIPSFQQGSRSPLTYHPEGNEFTLQEMSDVDGEKKQQSQSETTQYNSEQQQEQEERIDSEVQEGPPKPHPQVLESDDLRHPIAVSGNGSMQQKHSDESSQPVAKSVAANGLLQTNSSAVESQRAKQYMKQQRWLLILRHASKCDAPEGQCQIVPFCHHIKQLVKHISGCRERDCQYARCPASRSLLQHHNTCQDPRCPVCIPVKQTVMQQQMQASIMSPNIGKNDASGALKRSKVEIATNGDFTQQDFSVSSSEHAMRAWKTSSVKTEGDGQPFPKRIKIEPMQQQVLGPGIGNGKIEGRISTMKVESIQSLSVKSELGLEQEHKSMASQEVKKEPMSVSKSGKPMIVGTSLVELFTIDQIKMHISSLRQWIGQNKVKIEKNQVIEQQMTEGACRLCGVEKLIFEPPPIYCTSCGARVKRNLTYYTMAVGESRHYFCVPCYGDIRNDMVNLDGQIHPKTRLEKLKNDEETEEAWVQCDKCNSWQHQICALFNGRRNEGGDAAYTCPQCCVVEMEIGERKPLPPSAVLGARDLPKTILSDHLEQRLVRKLKQERTERARIQGKSLEEVLGAEGLVVRVVSSVDKKLEVKQRFLDLFPVGEYPPEFPYKSKVILLFQRIEGVEVCLFGLYVQEFGSECPNPNQRRVYLSYLDSVKYFRPDVKTSSGEALRTFVYHEILIGYLEYCKKRGFCSCYIWACPPLRGEDYILYCHPEIQKTPKSDKLREWYLTMLQKASADNVVVEVTNFLDYFFSVPEECKTKVTAARLPYFDGDYWPGAAEDALILHEQEREEENRLQKKGKNKKAVTKRAPKVDFPANASKDVSLMHRLGQAILPMKEDFIMVHMHYMCKHCCSPIVGGSRWICKQCKNFNLCGRCYDADQRLEERSRHPVNMKEAHHFFEVEVNDVPADTKDKDEIMESEFFDTRQAFLSLCQGNHYQYDTLRRAKHSSMMVLYHLHNPTAPAFVTSCNICHHDIETGQGFRCDTCPDFDICNACYQKEENKHHPHELTPHLTLSEQNAQNKEARQLRIKQLRNMLILLAHASKCCAPQCQYHPKCRNVKGLFRHGIVCRIRASGGCQRCKMMWSLLQLHARACREAECRVPRCKDLKEHFRRTQQQMDSRRRAAVNEMMRQRVAEVGGSS